MMWPTSSTLPLDLITYRVNLVASQQSLLLTVIALYLMGVAGIYIVRPRLFTVNARDEKGRSVPVLTVGYHRLMHVVSVAGWVLGALCTYSALWLGWTRAGDPVTLLLLFVGGASGMHVAGTRFRWAWIMAPVLAGVSTMELWGVLSASPDLWVSVASTLGLMIPIFLILLYVEHAHEAIGTLLVTSTGAFWVACLCLLQAMALLAGASLYLPLHEGIMTLIGRFR